MVTAPSPSEQGGLRRGRTGSLSGYSWAPPAPLPACRARQHPQPGLRVIDTHTLQRTAHIYLGSAQDVALSPDGPRAYVTNQGSNSVSAIDTSTNRATGTFDVQGPTRIALTPDGRHAWITQNCCGTVWDRLLSGRPAQGIQPATLRAQSTRIRCSHRIRTPIWRAGTASLQHQSRGNWSAWGLACWRPTPKASG
ncbi:YncE family protein [Streptomyces sp. NPDC001594]|uniref:YncE family protein n=1 Tax=Streptomyces sp. NPDC001594 TaxID=3364590 RepID=UPI0036A5F955